MFCLCTVDDIFAIDEIADIFGFEGHRLFDDVFIAIICAADGGIEQP